MKIQFLLTFDVGGEAKVEIESTEAVKVADTYALTPRQLVTARRDAVIKLMKKRDKTVDVDAQARKLILINSQLVVKY